MLQKSSWKDVEKKGLFIYPILKGHYKNQPYYNSQFAVLPQIYQQNASIEISKLM